MRAQADRTKRFRLLREAAKNEPPDPNAPVIPPIVPAGLTAGKGSSTGQAGVDEAGNRYGIMANGMVGYLPPPQTQGPQGQGQGQGQGASSSLVLGPMPGVQVGETVTIAPDGSAEIVHFPGVGTGGVVLGGLTAPAGIDPSIMVGNPEGAAERNLQ